MTKYYLPDWNYKSDYWDDDAMAAQATKYGDDTVPNCSCTRVICSQESYDRLIAISQQHVPDNERPLNDKFFAKWNVKQGGRVSLRDAQATLDPYYSNVTEIKFNNIAARYIRESMVNFLYHDPYNVYTDSLIMDRVRDVWAQFKADHKSDNGIVYHGDRRDHSTLVECIQLWHDDQYYLDPLIMNIRNKDGKLRGVFCDPQSNIFKEYTHFQRMFDWWHNHPSDHRYSDLYLSWFVSGFKAKSYYCGDYKSMDTHFTRDAAHLVVDIVCDAVRAKWNERVRIHDFVETLFHTEVILGKDIYVGLHAFLSGMYPTHDLESILNFSILVVSCKIRGIKVILEPRPLKKGEAFIIVCGDDSLVLFGTKYSEEELLSFAKTHCVVAHWVGQVMELSKVEYGYDSAVFCKKLLALHNNAKGFKKMVVGTTQIPLWKSSLPKAIHALWEPENLPTNDWNLTAYVLWMCSIMDGARGCEQYNAVVDALFEQLPFVPSRVDFAPDALQRAFEILNRDWWMRNFGEQDIQNSPTFIKFKVRFKL